MEKHYANIKSLVEKLNARELSENQQDQLDELLMQEGGSIALSHIELADIEYTQGRIELPIVANIIQDGYDTALAICGEFDIDISNPYILETIMDGLDIKANAWAKKEFGVDSWYEIGF